MLKDKLSDQYDLKALRKYTLMLLGMVAAVKVTGGFAMLAVPLFVIFAMTKRQPIELMFWVLFMMLYSCGNRAIFISNFIVVMTQRATLIMLTFMMAGQAFGKREARMTSPFWGILAYILWEFGISMQGFQPIVSYLKLVLFVCIFFAMMGVAVHVNVSSRVNAKILRSALLSFMIFMIIGSFLIIPIPSLSLMANKGDIERMLAGESISLFCGFSSHSQALGPMLGIFGTFLFADLVFSIKKWDPLYVVMLLICPILIYKTSSRTGMGTFIAGMGFVSFCVLQARGMGTHWKNRVVSTLIVCSIAFVAAILAVPSLREGAMRYALKWTGDKDASKETLTMETVVKSRQSLIDVSVYNFKKNPILGNGFQVSEEMAHTKYGSISKLLSAPIEKGVWIYAIPEEGGVVGMILFSGWLVFLFPTLIKRRAYVAAATFFTFAFANLGEFSFFSMSYVGGLYWSLALAASSLDVQRLKSDKEVKVFDVELEQVFEEVGYDEWVRRQG